MSRPLPRQLLADLALLLVALIWGSTFVLVKEAVSQVKPLSFIALRFALATLTMALLFRRRLRTLGRRGLLAGALIGLFLTAGYGFQTAGLQYTTASKAGFITGLSVVIVPFAAWLILGRRPASNGLAGVILATIGLALLSLQMGERLAIGRGDLLVLACSLSFALHIVTVGAFAPRMDPLALATAQIGVVALVSGVLALIVERDGSGFSGLVWFAALFTGLLATALAFAVQTAAQVFTTPTHTALIFATEPVFAALFGYLLAEERLTGRALLGCGLILAGMVVAELRISHYKVMGSRRAPYHGEGNGGEGQNKDKDHQERQGDEGPVQAGDVVQGGGVEPSEDGDQEGPQPPAAPEPSQPNEAQDDQPGQIARPFPQQRVDDMTPIELASRDQVQARDQQTRPASDGQRVQEDVFPPAGEDPPEAQDLERHVEQGIALNQERLAGQERGDGLDLGEGEPQDQDGDRQGQARERARHSDGQHTAAVDGRGLHPNEGSHGAEGG